MDYEAIRAKAKQYEQEDPEAGLTTCMKLAAVEALIHDDNLSTNRMLELVDQIIEARGWEIHHIVQRIDPVNIWKR